MLVKGLLMKCLGLLTFNDFSSGGYKIAPRACEVSGVQGTCMFVWECLKTDGQVNYKEYFIPD